jgi:cytochrome c oxidase cbb3-type subunit 2
LRSGWQGICLVAITYVYFLIFAQFTFLKRLNVLGIADTHLKAVMAAMAAGGILFSLLAPRVSLWPSQSLRLRTAFAASAVASLLSLLQLDLAGAAFVSFLIGAGLGLLTVTLVTHLRSWTGAASPFVAVGAGTGIGYFICNIPLFFDASSKAQSLVASVLCVAAAGITMFPAPEEASRPKQIVGIPFIAALAAFTALVWLDSAAFFIIQNTTELKAATWQGPAHLWMNGTLHLGAALVSAWLLLRRGLFLVVLLAVGALGSACLLLRDPASAPLASILYPIGVSLYSVALVAYPSLIASAGTVAERGRIAGWIYAVAGWFGSALGIGMGQNLGHVPAAFVFAATAVALIPAATPLWLSRRREITLTACVLLDAWLLNFVAGHGRASEQMSLVDRGRQVYISEGCIHCHTQYVRPGTADVLMWGPIRPIAEIREDRPPLIGNRRQGPDLSQIGARRSALWLRMHFFNPAEISGASVMPSYGFLFRDERGDDLIAYLMSLGGSNANAHFAEQNAWRPASEAVASASDAEGAMLYARDCATCHSANGAARIEWRPDFVKNPVDLTKGPHFYLSPANTPEERTIQLARITRFGIPGTDMAGHEYLSDEDVSSITLWLSQHIAQSNN